MNKLDLSDENADKLARLYTKELLFAIKVATKVERLMEKEAHGITMTDLENEAILSAVLSPATELQERKEE